MIRKQYEENGVGRLAVVEKKPGCDRWSGLKLLTKEVNGYQNVLELGYRLSLNPGKRLCHGIRVASLDYGLMN
ncbi:hypothetical protein EJ377_04325 [Chryseobacterium arthrosphaerae]|uniref:Uncharacterized protein n=1 Tax=Chryseobacterium arthrosphaerae TaxID=651561 RepID=A0A3S0Q7J9_9FLAO|nr:hypothetical protein EJ377_04325 [Chryseobacterium arthrosphaerae]